MGALECQDEAAMAAQSGGAVLTFLATLLAWAMSSRILRMLVVTLLTGFFSSTTFSFSRSSGTSTLKFSTVGGVSILVKQLSESFEKSPPHEFEAAAPASPADRTACS